MSAFLHNFSFGFLHGVFNGMFGGFGVCNWGLGLQNCRAGWYNYGYRNYPPSCFTSQYSTPECNLANTVEYRLQPIAPQFDYNIPNFTEFNTNIQSFNYPTPQFQYSFYNFGDTFIKREGNASSLKGKHWSQMTDEELRQVYGNYTRDITELCDISTPQKRSEVIEKLNEYLLDKGVLANKGETFVKAQEEHGVSATVLMAICMNESAKGSSNLATTKNNVGGVRKSGSTEYRNFSTVDECIDFMGSFLKSGYINNSRKLTKLYQINAKYCPASDPTDTSGINSNWAKVVDMYSGEIERALA